MARIPDRAPMGAPRTPSPTPRAASMGDLGLGAVGEALSRSGRGLSIAADRRAEEAFLRAHGEYETEYLPAASAYDGRQPGFAREQMARYDGVLAATAEQLDPDARRAFERAMPQRRAAQMEAAVRVEGQRTGEQRRLAEERIRRVDAIERVGRVRVAYAQSKRELIRGFDGSTPGLTDQGLALLDAAIAEHIEQAPPEVREELATQLAALRGDEWMNLQAFEGQARDAHLALTVNKAAEALIAAVISDPGGYDDAIRQARQLGAELPETAQKELIDSTVQSLTIARFQGLLQDGHWETVLSDLEGGTFDDELGADGKARVNQAAIQARAAAGFDPVSVQRQLDAQTAEQRVQSHLASIIATGQATNLTAAEVRRLAGPVAEAAFVRQEQQARAAYTVTRGLAALPPDEQLARVESLKPKGGEPDFAERQAVYELAVKTLTDARNLQLRDPAQATQTAETNAALWRAFQSAPTRENATLWADDTLRRQRASGTPETGLRVLPQAFAQQIAGRVKNAEGADTLPALQAAAALIDNFGGHEGRVLTDLTRAGLDPRDAAVLGQAGGNPVALEQYARARNRGNVGLTADKRRDTRSEVVRALGPLLETWAPLPGGQAGSDALVGGVETVAAALVADGRTPRQAAEEAARIYLRSYQFQEGYRIPRELTGRPVQLAYILPDEMNGLQGARAVAGRRGFDGGDRMVTRPAEEAFRIGALRTIVDLIENDGAALPAVGVEPHLTDAQKRDRLAGIIGQRGRWVSTLDDGGLMLVIPNPANPNGVVPVLGADGQPIRRTWAQLEDRARRPARDPGER